MGRVAERAGDGQRVEGDGGIRHPDVRRRQSQVLGEAARTSGPDADRFDAQMAAAGSAIAAMASDDVPFPGHQLTHVQTADVAAQLVNHADELLADDHRHRHRAPRHSSRW